MSVNFDDLQARATDSTGVHQYLAPISHSNLLVSIRLLGILPVEALN